MFVVSVPSNWRERPSSASVTFAPDGAYGDGVFTHGVEFGVQRNETHSLSSATDEFLAGVRERNPRLRVSGSSRSTVDGRAAMTTELTNVSEATGTPESLQVLTTLLSDGSLFYGVAVAPSSEVGTYGPAFRQTFRSLRLR